MATMYLLVRKLEHPDGTVSRFSLKLFTTDEQAQLAAKSRTARLGALIGGRIGVVRGGDVEDAGLTVGNFLQSLGVLSVAHDVETVEVHESDLATAAPRLILPS